ncbi:MAG: sulfotransferase family protein, partial [Pseudonocardiaceae bacterium]
MPLEVIGAGFGRTGTSSLQAALEKLGFGPCDHMKDVFRDAEHARLWDAATRGETVDWHQVFAGYRSTVDWPGCAVYEQLMD